MDKKDPFELFNKREILPEICDKHGCNIERIFIPVRGTDEKKASDFCPECTDERRKAKEIQIFNQATNQQLYAKTYNVLERDSLIPKELKQATFSNFLAETAEEKSLLAFAKEQAQKYLEGETGNTIITGGTGIGKSHLSLAIAKEINDGYKAKNEPKSVLFVSLTEIIKQIKAGWNYGNGAKLTEEEAVKHLVTADFLIIDDLGAKNSEARAKSEWEQDFLFDILNNRETTIINTNLDSSELLKVYNERNASRILKGSKGNIFKAFSIKDKRYSINELKSKREARR